MRKTWGDVVVDQSDDEMVDFASRCNEEKRRAELLPCISGELTLSYLGVI